MLDGAGAVVHRTVRAEPVVDDSPQQQKHPVGRVFFVVGANRTLLDTMSIYPKQTSEAWIAPVGYRIPGGNLTDGNWQPSVEFEDEITLPFEELQKVVKYAAHLEPVPEGEEPEDNRSRLPNSGRTSSRFWGSRS